MDNNRTLLIVNPISGVNPKREKAGLFKELLVDAGLETEIAFTQRQGHASELASQAVADGYANVVVCGGDGTVNEVASALIGTDTVLGIIPSGSGNGLARHLEIPVDEERSIDIIKQGNILDCDCGEVSTTLSDGSIAKRNFFCTCGIGFDAMVSHKFANEARRGRMTYIKNTFEVFANYRPKTYRLKINGETIEYDAFLIACCNASQYGNNAFIAPNASVTDGYLDVIVVKSGNALQMMVAGFDVLTGMVPYNKEIEKIRIKEGELEVDKPTWAHIDGEPVPFEGRVHVKCLPHKLKVFTNPNRKSVKPFITPLDFSLRDWGIALGKIFKP